MFCVRGTEKEWRHFGTPSKPDINAVHRGNVAALLMVEPTNRRAIVVDRDGIESSYEGTENFTINNMISFCGCGILPKDIKSFGRSDMLDLC